MPSQKRRSSRLKNSAAKKFKPDLEVEKEKYKDKGQVQHKKFN